MAVKQKKNDAAEKRANLKRGRLAREVRVKKSTRRGRVTRNPVTMDDVVASMDTAIERKKTKVNVLIDQRNALVDECENESLGLFGRVGKTAGVVVEGVIGFGRVALDTILDGLAAFGRGVLTFIGRVFDTVAEWVGAICTWLGECAYAVSGHARASLLGLKDWVASRRADWIATPGRATVIKWLAAAASVVVGISAGVMVGVTMAGVAGGVFVSAGMTTASAVFYSKVVGLISAGLSGGFVSGILYSLWEAGVDRRVLASAYNEAQTRRRGRPAAATA